MASELSRLYREREVLLFRLLIVRPDNPLWDKTWRKLRWVSFRIQTLEDQEEGE